MDDMPSRVLDTLLGDSLAEFGVQKMEGGDQGDGAGTPCVCDLFIEDMIGSPSTAACLESPLDFIQTQEFLGSLDAEQRQPGCCSAIPRPACPIKDIILSHEKNIQKLNELVRNLREQLLQCKGNNETINGSATLSTRSLNELERQQILQD
ncbi:hypothetical protein HHK36_019384 [Tetracentron sinense]|uniref:Uncharacterized protein n=1 Tax=Tetracentron sinense TaxID=13715 RepID=A0A834YZU5_TETSI|nr:hypothetical protein HHK36_019384 [Tetracentron sinense]